MNGTFIKGAYIELCRYDDRYNEYYCCSERNLFVNIPEDRTIEPFYSCGKFNQKKICDMYDVDGSKVLDVKIPEWCPLKQR